MEMELWRLYESGHLTKGQYHHAKDKRYETMHGMQVSRRVGKMTEGQKDLIEAFVEENEGEREQRLKHQIEKDVGFGHEDDFQEGLVDDAGRVLQLHPMDRRAVEFRERLRTW